MSATAQTPLGELVDELSALPLPDPDVECVYDVARPEVDVEAEVAMLVRGSAASRKAIARGEDVANNLRLLAFATHRARRILEAVQIRTAQPS